MGCSCAFKISFLKYVQTCWIPFLLRTVSQGLSESLSWTDQSLPSGRPRQKFSWCPLFFHKELKAIILWSLCPRQPLSTTAPPVFPYSQKSRSSEAFPHWLTHTICVRKLSSTQSRNILECLLSALLSFQQRSSKSKLDLCWNNNNNEYYCFGRSGGECSLNRRPDTCVLRVFCLLLLSKFVIITDCNL